MSSFPGVSNTAILCLGSNLGNRAGLLSRAEMLLAERCGSISKRSDIYETEAWGSDSERAYLNQVLELKTSLSPSHLLKDILRIESQLGRERTGDRNADRLIDIDILFFNNLVLHENELNIPHPRLHERRFVLVPLNEIVPALIHPRLNKSVGHLLELCTDPLQVRPYGGRG